MTDTNPLKPGFWMTDEARGHSEPFRAMTRDTLTMLIQHANSYATMAYSKRSTTRSTASRPRDGR